MSALHGADSPVSVSEVQQRQCEVRGDAVRCAVNGHNLVAAVISDTMPPIDTAN